jgi:hypothetical protein
VIAGYQSVIARYPDHQITIIILTNQDTEITVLFQHPGENALWR